jgi:ankyrin repeat protein
VYAVESNNYPALLACISRGADVNVQDKVKSTPLHAAIFLGFLHLAATLLQAKADPNLADSATGPFRLIEPRFSLP